MFLLSSSLKMELFLLNHTVFDVDSFYFTQEELPAHLKVCQSFSHGSKKRHCLLEEHHQATTTTPIPYVLKSNTEGSHMLLFIHPIIQSCNLSINALRCRGKPKLIKICWDYLLVFHISSTGARENWRGIKDVAESILRAKERGCCRYLKSWGFKMEGRQQK